MNQWSAYPFLRITAAWTIGIVAGAYCFMGGIIILAAMVVLFSLCLIFYAYLPKNSFYKWNPLLGISMLLLIFLAGAFHSSRNDHSRIVSHLSHYDSIEAYKGIVSESVQETARFNKTKVRVNEIKTNENWHRASGEILLYFPREMILQYGDMLLAFGRPDEISPPSNPYEFDYRRFLQRQNVFHQHFVRQENEILIIGSDQGSGFYSMVLRVRKHAANLIKTHMQGKHEQAVALALVMGIKDELDNELTRAYGIAGAMHVLAVSGLHVGIVYGFLLLIFGNIRRRKHGRIIFAVINLLALWTYALLTGFAPSTIRATIMFSAIIISQAFRRQTSIYNSIFFSAFIILLYNPNMIFAIGFQLSFLAVLGIVYLTPKIHRSIEVDHRLLDKMWMLICVSLAAQIATFPVTVYYFNQFPVYFWAVNLVVIPAAFVILISGIVFLTVGGWPWLGTLTGKVVELVIWGMNKVIFTVEKIPGSVVYPIKVSATQVFLLYLFMLAILFFFHFKKLRLLVVGLACLAIFVSMDVIHSLNCSNQRQIMFYSISGHAAIDFIDGRKSYLYSSPELLSDKDILKYSIFPFHIAHNLSCNILNTLPLAISETHEHFDMIVFRGKKIVYLKGPVNNLVLEDKIRADFLVIGNNSTRNLNDLQKNFDAEHIIIDAANSRWLASRLYQQAQQSDVKCISLPDQGGKLFKL
jgi:competence protein ComEC